MSGSVIVCPHDQRDGTKGCLSVDRSLYLSLCLYGWMAGCVDVKENDVQRLIAVLTDGERIDCLVPL